MASVPRKIITEIIRELTAIKATNKVINDTSPMLGKKSRGLKSAKRTT